jgi:histidinol-phosphate/aromatic aminotransferase/cobyric acid decarboxylase-like protein/SAM-dependent methyltransferase
VTNVPWYEDYFTEDYWSYADAEYTSERTQAEISYLAQMLAEHAPGSRVLDLGCGVGRHAIGLARLGFEVTGVDVSKYALDRAARAAAEAGVRMALHRADLLTSADWGDLLGPAGQGQPVFDAAICVQAFGWGRDADQLRLLRRVRRLLPAGGLLVLDHSSILAITRMYAAHARAEIGAGTFTFSRSYDPASGRSAGQVLVERRDGTRAVLPDDIRLYTPAEIKAMLIQAGFDVIRADADFSPADPVTIATRYVQFLATPAPAVTPAHAGHRGQVSTAEIDLRWAPDEAGFTRDAVATAWAKLAAEPLALPDLARRYDLTDPYGGERAADVLAAHLHWPEGTGLAAGRVSTGAGVTGLLHGLARLADGGSVLIAPYGHPQLAEAAAAAGGQVAVAPLTDLTTASAAIAVIGPAVIVIDRPSFTGPCWSVSMIAELAAITWRAGAVLVVDESYACYLPPGDSAARLTDTTPGLVVLRGVSKGFCCGGLRIGFAVASPGLASQVRTVLPPLAGAALSLDVALELLAGPDPFGPLRARIAAVKPTVETAARRAGLVVEPTDPRAPWTALQVDPATRVTLARCGLAVKEVPELGQRDSAGNGLARMSVPLSEQRVAAVAAALARAADPVLRL